LKFKGAQATVNTSTNNGVLTCTSDVSDVYEQQELMWTGKAIISVITCQYVV